MLVRIAAIAILLSALALPASAQDEPTLPQLVPQTPDIEAPAGEPEEPLTLHWNCYTNDRECYGRAYWKNENNRYISVAVFYNNGAGGRTNFVLPPGQDHWIGGIRYNDTFASAWGNSGVPDGTQRYYIYVCCQ